MGIALMGGEPFIREDFSDVYNYIARKGIIMKIDSNGTLLKRDVLREMKRYPYHQLRISLYGASDSTYGNLCGNRLAFRKAMEGISLAKEEGINFYIYTVANKINQKDLMDIKQIAEKFKVGFFPQYHLTAKTDNDTSHYELSLIKKRFRKKMCDGCIFVDNLGRLDICPIKRKPSYNLNCISLQEALQYRWDNKFRIECPIR
jgi:MoaA/NifB/PqqE/SkfB family radical SAM enzyme